MTLFQHTRHSFRPGYSSFVLKCLAIAISVQFLNPVFANQSSLAADDIRIRLSTQPVAPELQQAVKNYRAIDPSARFTYLRGHVDSFSAHPRQLVPDYAHNILKDAGLPTNTVAQPLAQTSTEPKGAEGNLAVARENLAGKNLGNNGPDDGGVANDIVTDEDPHLAETKWYAQSGENVVVPILRAFLSKHNDVFEVPQQQLENNLPNLELKRYGVGRHFRRAEFMQSVGKDMPVLDGKTIVLFDLNWNVINISRQLMTPQKIGLVKKPAITASTANMKALSSLGLTQETGRIVNSTLGIDPIQAVQAWQVQVVNTKKYAEYTVTLDGATGNVMNISDDTARFNDAQVKRWDYEDGDRTRPSQLLTTGVYTHDDNTLVHDFFYLVNDDRNDGGTGVCAETSPDSNSTPNAYGTTTSSEYVRPTRRGDRNFSLWLPRAPKGPYGEGHVYYWARKYMQWQKQALVDLGVLTLGNFNNYTKALLIVNSCDDDAGHYDANFLVSTMDDLGENLPTILLPERCREGNSNCTQAQYQANSTNLYTFEGDGGYHFPGVIHHELNHFVLQDYFNVDNGKNCSIQKENKYFQEGGLGRTLAQMYWHNHYNVGYKPENPDHTVDTNRLFRSDGISGQIHDERDATSLNEIANFACGTDGGDPYSWGSVVHQPMWEIYHGEKVEGSSRVHMGRPATDNDMIKSMYYAADLTSASSFPSRFQLANKFMEYWELFSSAVSTTKEDWCEVWQHHGMDTFIDVNYCS